MLLGTKVRDFGRLKIEKKKKKKSLVKLNLTFTKDKPPCPDVESEAVWVKFLGSGWGQFVRSGLGAGCEIGAGGLFCLFKDTEVPLFYSRTVKSGGRRGCPPLLCL